MPSYSKGYKRERDKPWVARIRVNGKDKYIGTFHTREQAERAEIKAKEDLKKEK